MTSVTRAKIDAALSRLDSLAGTPWENLVVSRRDHSAYGDAARAEGLLAGMTLAVKDSIDVCDLPSRAGSNVLTSRSSAGHDAPVVAALHATGAVTVAKTHMHELGAGATGLFSKDGPALNPHDPTRVTGGSSSGSAALVAMGIVDLALGTDTGSSTRGPAAMCGCVGFVPRQAALSRDGIQPLSRTLDRVGLLARDVETVARAWSSLTPAPTALPPPSSPVIGIMACDDADPEVSAALDLVVAHLETKYETRVLDFAIAEDLSRIYDTIVAYEFGAVVLALGEQVSLLGADVRQRLARAGTPSRAAYAHALRELASARSRARTSFPADILLLPTCPQVAPTVESAADPATSRRVMSYCVPFSVLDLPAVSVPAPTHGLPVGAQLVAVSVEESQLLDVAVEVEQAGVSPEMISRRGW